MVRIYEIFLIIQGVINQTVLLQMLTILFSDLHLSPSTFETCMQILRRILSEANKLNAQVYFLGDFFDTVYSKGTLPVDMLNNLMIFFKKEWNVKLLMFPGNHDYMDAAETEHGLTPFGYCNDLITILDNPRVIDRQLFIPWRRNNQTLKKIITENSDVDVIFAHLDIVGFMLNASKISTEGLQMTDLPTDMPIYTGHYHTPQTIRNIRYLGSPFQLSLSEAEDKKSLVVLSENYQVDHLIPIDYGPHQFKWTLDELERRHTELRPGDRVSVTVLATENVLHLITDLENKGIIIQIKKPILLHKTRIADQKLLSSQQMLEAYGQRTNVDTESQSWQVLCKWLGELPVTASLDIAVNDVRPIKLEMNAFGPFKGHLSLALEGQGFTLISAECETANSSNGAGKSMLAAGAFLWCLTGSIDGRGSLTFGGNVVHTNMPSCTVAISGTVNNVPWKVTRSLSEKKKTTLLLEMNNADVTRSTIGATQKAIASDVFGMDMSAALLHKYLQNNSIWTQKSSPRWLDASDTAAKAEIAPFAKMNTWIALADKAKQLQKSNKKNLENVSMQLKMKTDQLKLDAERVQRLEKRRQQWLEEHQTKIEQALQELLRATSAVDNCTVPIKPISSVNVAQLRSSVNQKRNEVSMCQAKLNGIPTLPDPLPEKPVNITDLKAKKEQRSSDYQNNMAALRQSKQALQHFHANGECHTCHRKFDGVDHSQVSIMTETIANVEIRVIDSRLAMELAGRNLASAEQALKYHEYTVLKLDTVKKMEILRRQAQRLDGQLQSTEHFSAALAAYQSAIRLRDALMGAKDRSVQHLQRIKAETCPFQITNKESNRLKSEQASLLCRKKELLQKQETIAAISAWVGPRGIQTYALDFVVNKLAVLMTNWLQKLFDNNNVSMTAYFDESERLVRQIKSSTNNGILSGGQYQRCQLACFLAFKELYPNNFPFICLDEATASLDIVGIKAVQRVFRDWCSENENRTCLFISHDSTQFTETDCYQNFVKINHKRGRSSITDTGSYGAKKRKLF
jgi:hypothetical protein